MLHISRIVGPLLNRYDAVDYVRNDDMETHGGSVDAWMMPRLANGKKSLMSYSHMYLSSHTLITTTWIALRVLLQGTNKTKRPISNASRSMR